jgi:hypothetical protein
VSTYYSDIFCNFLFLEASEEIIQLKEQLNTFQMQAEQDHNGERSSDIDRNQKELQLQNEISAMQEMLTTLTEQKLCFTMEVSVVVNTEFKPNLYNQGSIILWYYRSPYILSRALLGNATTINVDSPDLTRKVI